MRAVLIIEITLVLALIGGIYLKLLAPSWSAGFAPASADLVAAVCFYAIIFAAALLFGLRSDFIFIIPGLLVAMVVDLLLTGQAHMVMAGGLLNLHFLAAPAFGYAVLREINRIRRSDRSPVVSVNNIQVAPVLASVDCAGPLRPLRERTEEAGMQDKRNNLLGRTIVRDTRGMTLVEIMVVITIIGIMTGAIGFAVFNYLARAKIKTTKMQIKKVAQVLINYAEDIENNEDGYPNSLDVLAQGKYALLKKRDLKDGWGQPLMYNYPAQKNPDAPFDICSKGPDKKEGGEDDICFSE